MTEIHTIENSMNSYGTENLSLTFCRLLGGSVWCSNSDEGLSTSVERSIEVIWACIILNALFLWCGNISFSFSRLFFLAFGFVLIVEKSWPLAFEGDVVSKGILV